MIVICAYISDLKFRAREVLSECVEEASDPSDSEILAEENVTDSECDGAVVVAVEWVSKLLIGIEGISVPDASGLSETVPSLFEVDASNIRGVVVRMEVTGPVIFESGE